MRAAMMKATIAALATAALTAQASAQTPPMARAISPIFGQLVSFGMPLNFVAVFEETKGIHYIREAVLKGESAQAWTQMITVTGEKGAAANADASPEKVAGGIAGGFRSACPDSFAARSFGAVKFGSFDGFIAVIGCGNAGGHSETAALITLKGTSDYYTIQWAERGPAGAKPPIDDEKWTARLRALRPIDLCPIVPGEKAPYPSCVNKG